MEAGQCVFATELGWIGLQSTSQGLRRLILPVNNPLEACILLGMTQLNAEPPSSLLDTVERLKRYFNGEPVSFHDILDLSGFTDFQIKVWQVTREIPYGETRSYRWVAEHLGKPEAARAVGLALSRNPLPIIIPCHRVVERGGNIGGYTGGIHLKRYLLWLEATAYLRGKK